MFINHSITVALQEQYADRCGDGTWEGVRYFSCDYGRAFFCPVSTLKPDQRFTNLGPPPGTSKASGNRTLLIIFCVLSCVYLWFSLYTLKWIF